jgi:hypothetical protein
MFSKLLLFPNSEFHLVQDCDIERVFRSRFPVERSVDEELSGGSVEPKDGVDVAVADDVQQVAVEAEVTIVSIDLKKEV